MTRRPAVDSARTQFDEFLYAPIGEESNGTLLSVLSALARRHVDPWDEASRLAQLPREAATNFLTALIDALPVAIVVGTDAQTHAKRLSALLPLPPSAVNVSSTPKFALGAAIKQARPLHIVLYYILVTALFFGAQWLMQRPQQATPPVKTDAPTKGTQSPPPSTSGPEPATDRR